MTVPRALTDHPADVPLLGPPQVELQVKANDRYVVAPAQPLRLIDAFDLSAFGEPDSDPSRQGAATVIAPIGLGHQERRRGRKGS